MKAKIIAFIIFLQLVNATYAVVNLAAELPVVLDLTENGQAFVEIGFSSNVVNSLNDEIDMITGNTVPIEFSSGSDMNGQVTDDVYVYWKILSAIDVKAELAISEALKGQYGNIDWFVSIDETEDRIGGGDYSRSLSILTPDAKFVSIGSVKLDIGTENLETGDVIPGVYMGELKLNISIN